MTQKICLQVIMFVSLKVLSLNKRMNLNTYLTCIRSNQHMLVQEDGKVHLETTFVYSLFKGLPKRDVADVEDDKFLIERSKQILDYDMVTPFHLFNNPYRHYFQ
jgi:hypothetical protein